LEFNEFDHYRLGPIRRLRALKKYLATCGKFLVGQLHGPLAFRLSLQPIVAVILAIRAGLRDARAGRPAYFWAVQMDLDHRKDLLRRLEGCGKIFVMPWLWTRSASSSFFVGSIRSTLGRSRPYLVIRVSVNISCPEAGSGEESVKVGGLRMKRPKLTDSHQVRGMLPLKDEIAVAHAVFAERPIPQPVRSPQQAKTGALVSKG
jgi:hypothetical protein